MDEHMKELFKQARRFDEEELFDDPEFMDRVEAVLELEQEIVSLYGSHSLILLLKHIVAQGRIDEYRYLHYFHQGYLAAQKELEKSGDK